MQTSQWWFMDHDSESQGVKRQPKYPPGAGELADPVCSEDVFSDDNWLAKSLLEKRVEQARGGGLSPDRPPASAIAGSLRFLS